MAAENQHLKHGKALCGNVFARFVETFNALVDFMCNVKGDADGKNGEGHIKLDRTNPSHPVIRCDGCGGSAGSGVDQTVVTDIDSVELLYEESTPKLKINYKKKTVKVVSNNGSETSDSVKLPLENTDVVKESSYDTGTHKFENTLVSVVVFDTGDPEGTSPAEVFRATPHSSEGGN